MFLMIPWMAATNGHVFGGQIKLVGSVCKLHHPDSLFHPECLPSPRWPLTVTDLNATTSGLNPSPLNNGTSPDSPGTGSSSHVFSIFSFAATAFGNLLGKAIAVAMIGYMESMTIAKTVARTHSEETGTTIHIDPSKELVALGICNLVCSQMSGYPVTGSFSRTAVNADSGAQTQLAALFAAVLVGMALLMLTPVLQYIPKLSLAAIVLIAILKLIKLREAMFLWHVKRRDFFVYASVVLITVFLGVEAALVVGILESWLLLLSNTNRAHAMVLRHAAVATDGGGGGSGGGGGGDGGLSSSQLHQRINTPSNYQIIDVVEEASNPRHHHDDVRHASLNGQPRPSTLTSSRIAVVRLFNDLSFASAASFREVVEETVAVADPAVVVIDATSVNDVDGSGFYSLMDVASALQHSDTKLFFAAMPLHARRVIAKAIRYTKNDAWDLRLRREKEEVVGGGGGGGGGDGGGTKIDGGGGGGGEEEETSSPSVQFFATTKGAIRAARMELLKRTSKGKEMSLDNAGGSSNVEFRKWESE